MKELPPSILEPLRKIHAESPQHGPMLSQLRRELLARFAELEQQLAAAEGRQGDSQLEQLAYQDAVTGLPNQVLGRRFLEQLLHRIGLEDGCLALVVMDVREMRDINRYLGRELGDAFLFGLAQHLRQQLGDSEVLTRGEEDEFWWILHSQQAGASGLQKLISRTRAALVGLQESLQTPLPVQQQCIRARLRLGFVCGTGEDRWEDLLERARWAAESVSSDEEVGFWQPAEQLRLEARRRLVPELREALDREQFVLCFQPIVKLENLQIQGIECLLRWEHPQQGRLGPDAFLSAACQSGLMVPIGDWVMQQACRLGKVLPHHYVTFNLSAQEMLQGDFPQRLARALAVHKIRADRLMLEVSEIHLALDQVRFFDVLREVRRWNVHIAVDDFTFDSFSLRRLEKIQARFLKLGPDLARHIQHPSYAGLLKGAALVAEGMGCRLIAEGIESDEQLQRLREGGCHWGQGTWLGPFLERSDLFRALGYEEESPDQGRQTEP